MSFVFYFFCKDIRGVDQAGNMSNVEFVEVLHGFTHCVFTQRDVFSAFGGGRLALVDAALVVVE